MTGPLAVRLCWGALVVLGAVAIFPRIAPESELPGPGTVEPLVLPDLGQMDQTTVEYGDSGVLVSKRNPFDSRGEAWNPGAVRPARPVKTVKATPALTAPDGVKGMFRIPGVEGVFVADDFVEIGETVQGARVERIDGGDVVFSRDRSSSVIWSNAEREQRKQQFKKWGMPLDGTRTQ